MKCICALRVSEKQDNVEKFDWSMPMVPGTVDISLYFAYLKMLNAALSKYNHNQKLCSLQRLPSNQSDETLAGTYSTLSTKRNQ